MGNWMTPSSGATVVRLLSNRADWLDDFHGAQRLRGHPITVSLL
jgi:hypothetical protein